MTRSRPRLFLGIALLLGWSFAAAAQDSATADDPAASIDYGFCGGKPVYPVIGVNFSTFCGPRNQIVLGRFGRLMWLYPRDDGLSARHQGGRQLTEEELAALVLLAEAAQIAPPPPRAAGTARYELGIDFHGRQTQRADGVLMQDDSSAVALIDAMRRLVPGEPLLPKCRNAPPADAVFSPTLLPDERRAAVEMPPVSTASAIPVTARTAGEVPALPSAGAAGIAVAPAKRVRPHTLINQDGASTVFPAVADGRWRLAFFGYTHCPDVCPMTLHKVVQALDRLGPKAAQLDTFFISVDSERDDAERVRTFVHQFDANIIGLTADPDTLKSLADEFGVLVRRYRGKTALAYMLQHSSLIYLLDPQGELRRLYPARTSAETIATELALLLPPAPAAGATVSAFTAAATPAATH